MADQNSLRNQAIAYVRKSKGGEELQAKHLAQRVDTILGVFSPAEVDDLHTIAHFALAYSLYQRAKDVIKEEGVKNEYLSPTAKTVLPTLFHAARYHFYGKAGRKFSADWQTQYADFWRDFWPRVLAHLVAPDEYEQTLTRDVVPYNADTDLKIFNAVALVINDQEVLEDLHAWVCDEEHHFTEALYQVFGGVIDAPTSHKSPATPPKPAPAPKQQPAPADEETYYAPLDEDVTANRFTLPFQVAPELLAETVAGGNCDVYVADRSWNHLAVFDGGFTLPLFINGKGASAGQILYAIDELVTLYGNVGGQLRRLVPRLSPDDNLARVLEAVGSNKQRSAYVPPQDAAVSIPMEAEVSTTPQVVSVLEGSGKEVYRTTFTLVQLGKGLKNENVINFKYHEKRNFHDLTIGGKDYAQWLKVLRDFGVNANFENPVQGRFVVDFVLGSVKKSYREGGDNATRQAAEHERHYWDVIAIGLEGK